MKNKTLNEAIHNYARMFLNTSAPDDLQEAREQLYIYAKGLVINAKLIHRINKANKKASSAFLKVLNKQDNMNANSILLGSELLEIQGNATRDYDNNKMGIKEARHFLRIIKHAPLV